MADSASAYPEHEKLAAVQSESDAIGEFLESMDNKGVVLGHHVKFDGYSTEQFVPLRTSATELLAEHFGIDLKVLEQEKRQMLKDFQDQQK